MWCHMLKNEKVFVAHRCLFFLRGARQFFFLPFFLPHLSIISGYDDPFGIDTKLWAFASCFLYFLFAYFCCNLVLWSFVHFQITVELVSIRIMLIQWFIKRALIPNYYLLPCRHDRESDSEAEDIEHAKKLRQVKAVLEEVIFWKLLQIEESCAFF